MGACNAAIRVDSDETEDAIRTITEVCKKHSWELRVWDHVMGVQWYNGEPPKQDVVPPTKKTMQTGSLAEALNNMGGIPPPQLSALQALLSFLDEPAVPDMEAEGEPRPVILLMKNFHLAFESSKRGEMSSAIQHLVSDKIGHNPRYAEFAQRLMQFQLTGESDTGKFLVGIMPQEAKLPPEVRPLFKVLTHELPDEEELKTIFSGIILGDEEGQTTIPEDIIKITCKHALGLTRLQSEGVFSAALVQHGNDKNFNKLLPEFVWKQKSEILNAEGLVSLYQGKETYKDVVGHKGAKEILSDLLAPDKHEPDNPDMRSRGVALVGPPRTGKSLVAKALGNEKGRPTLIVDLGAWFGGVVGETEARTRKGFQTIRAHAPCIAVIDEVEKVMPSSRGGDHDSGVSRRMAGSFMTQMQDIQEDVFWCFTANGVEDLHEAFLADERVDHVFYVPMPGPEQRAAGWKMMLGKYFPAEIDGVKFEGHLETSFIVLYKELKAAKKIDPHVLAHRFVAALLCLAGEERKNALTKLEAQDANVFGLVKNLLFKDDGWTIARIRSVCRLARKRNKSISYIARTKRSGIPAKLRRAIDRLEKWASNDDVVSAETGEAYEQVDEAEQDETGEIISNTLKHTGKAKRRVRKIEPEED